MRQTRPVQQADLRLLRVFQTIVQSGGISAAEIALDVGRSTISRQLSDLELRLGMKLCDRGPGGFALTEEGNQVYEAATRLLASVDNFAVEINEVNNRLIGRLSIALFDMTLTNPNSKISDAFRRFDEAAPDVTLSLRVLGTDDAEKGLLNSEIHVAVVPAQRRSSSLDYHPLYSEAMYLYCGTGHPLFDKLDEAISTSEVRASHYVGLDFHSPNMAASQRNGSLATRRQTTKRRWLCSFNQGATSAFFRTISPSSTSNLDNCVAFDPTVTTTARNSQRSSRITRRWRGLPASF